MATPPLAPPPQRIPPSEEKYKDLADTIRSLLDHESDAISQRMGWLGTFQGLLLAGTGVMWDKADKKPVYLFCVLGLLVTLSMWAGIYTASIGTDNIRGWWRTHAPTDYWGPGVISFFPKDGQRWVRVFAPWFAIPVLFIFSWLGIIFLNYWRIIPPAAQPTPIVDKLECTCPQPGQESSQKHAVIHSASHPRPLPQAQHADH